MSTDSHTDGSDNPYRGHVRALLRPFIDKGLAVKLVLLESRGKHYVSVAKKLDDIPGLFELTLIPYPERHYRGIERLYGDSVFVPYENLDLSDRSNLRVNIIGKAVTQLTREQSDYLYKKGL